MHQYPTSSCFCYKGCLLHVLCSARVYDPRFAFLAIHGSGRDVVMLSVASHSAVAPVRRAAMGGERLVMDLAGSWRR